MGQSASDTVTIEGKRWIVIKAAAKLLCTTTPRVLRLIDAGTFESAPHPRRNTLVVRVDQLLEYRTSEANPNRQKCRELLKTDVGSQSSVGKMIDTPATRGAGSVSWPMLKNER